MSRVVDGLQDGILGRVHVEPDDLGPGGHQRLDGPIAELENALHHVPFLGFDDAGLRALFDQHADFFFGQRRFWLGIDPQDAQHGVGGQAQQAHHRPGDDR